MLNGYILRVHGGIYKKEKEKKNNTFIMTTINSNMNM